MGVVKLAQALDLPEDSVQKVYESECARLWAQARITTFVPVLAMRTARSILRDRALRATLG